MAYTITSRPPSPTPSTNSSNVSPASRPTSLAASPMLPSSEENDSGSRSHRGTPNRAPADLPRNQISSRGGCWTCRLRRKKCDEQREGNSCHTCKRLTIECLGWGPKRPEWMRDKQAVERYKAEIKAKLTRAGLIRGQPRTSLIRNNENSTTPHPRSQPYPRPSTSEMALSNSSQTSSYGYSTPEETYNHNNAIFPTMSDASTSYQQTSSHFNDRTAIVHELAPSYYSYSPITPSSASTTQSIDPFDYQFTPGGYIPDSDNFSLSFQVPNVTLPLQSSASIEHSVDEHVLYYFSQVQKAQPMFVGNGLADITYTLITQEPKGAVTNAVCALSSLHFVQMRISQGLEMQNPSREQTKATYFRDEAFFQISSSRQLHGRYTDSDAIAALHLVTFSQLSGGQYPWHDAFSILNDWLVQAALPSATNPRLIYENMSNVGQYAVKVILSLDIFTSFSASYPPKFLGLMKELLGKDVWSFRNKDSSHKIQMEAFAGLTNEILLGIAEINALSHWKLLEKNKGSLSYRELVRRGDSIEQLLRENFEPSISRDQVQEHTKVIESVIGAGEEAKRLVIDIFREGALLYLHTVVNGFNPGVPEIMSSVDTILRLFYSLQPSELDRLLVFPTCLAACMTDDSTHREYLKNRLQARSSVIGNLVQIGTVMELVWRRRDANGGAIDLRDAIKETGLALLLV